MGIQRRSAGCRWVAAAVLSALVLPAFGGVAAQDSNAGADADQTFAERVDVNVVTVDVVVTDRQGRPVSDLTVDEFELFEDGRPVAISNFAVRTRSGRGAAPAASPEPPTAGEPGDEPAVPAAARPRPAAAEEAERKPLRLIVFVDNVNIRAVHRKRAFQDLRAFLFESLQPGDQVMLVSYERSLKVKHPFTSDTRLIATTLFELERLATNTTQYKEERRNLIERIEEARSPSHIRTWLASYAQSAQADLLPTLAALNEMVDSLAGLEGRKALLYVSDGLPMTPGEEFFVAVQSTFPNESFILDARSWDATSRFQALAARANSNRVSFYTLDAAGVRVSSAMDVERKAGGAYGGFYNSLDSATTLNLHNSIKFLADATGGAAIVNTNNFRPGLEAMAADFEEYYSLGYHAAHYGDGRYHRIEVKLKRKGLKARHREGYRDKPVFDRMADATLSSLRWGLERNELGLEIGFSAPEPAGEGEDLLVTMLVRIPMRDLVLVPRGEDAFVGLVKLYVAVADNRSRVARPQEVRVPIRIPAGELEQARGRSWDFRVPLRMRAGPQRVAVGARDELGATESFVGARLTVAG